MCGENVRENGMFMGERLWRKTGNSSGVLEIRAENGNYVGGESVWKTGNSCGKTGNFCRKRTREIRV